MTESRDNSWRWAQLIAVAVIAIAVIPYLCGHLNAPAGMRYMGFADHPYDQNSYISRVQQAKEGKFFIRRDFTLEPQRPLFFNPFTWTLGRLACWLELSPLTVYRIATAVYAYLLLMGIYWFIGLFFADPRKRLFAFALCAFSSGLCWIIPYHSWQRIAQVTGYKLIPICYWIAETILFEAILSFPQFTLMTLLMILGLGLFLKAQRGRLVFNSVLGGACVGLLAFVHTVDVVTVYTVLAAYAALRLILSGREGIVALRAAILVVVVSLPAMVYQYYLFSTEPVFIRWSKETFISPNPLSYIIGYGIVLVLALPEMVRIVRRGTRDEWLLFVWVAAVAALLYAPISFQRRLSTGVHIPLCILAASTVFRHLLPWLKRILGRRYHEITLLACVVIATAPANFVKIANCCREQRMNPLEFYLPTGDREAMDWMRVHHNEDAGILSGHKSGLYLPAYTGNRVFVGHWSETLDFNRKARMAELLLHAPGDTAVKRFFLKQNGIRYIYYGGFERMRGPFALRGADFLEQVYRKKGVEIYRVKE